MKRFLVFLICSPCFYTLSAQSLLEQGTVGIGTNASYYNILDESQSAKAGIKVLPSFDFFIMENFSIGFACSLSRAQNSDEKNEWQFGPNARYFFNTFYHFKPFIGANYLAGPSHEYINGNLGAVFFLTKNFAVETQAQYNHMMGQSSMHRIIFSGGIRVFM